MRVGVKSGPLSVSGRPFTSPTVAWIGTFAIAWAVLTVALARSLPAGACATVGVGSLTRASTEHASSRRGVACEP